MDKRIGAVGRRAFLGRIAAGTAAGALLAGCELVGVRPPPSTVTGAPSQTAAPGTVAPGTAAPGTAAPAAAPNIVRLSSVVIPQETGLYAQLLPEFERRSGLKVEITTGTDVYGPAREGKADIVLSHYQHEGVSGFMQDGFGEWPRMAWSSPGAVIGAPGDPAKVRGLTDIVEAFRRIGRSGASFIVNDQDGLRYVAEVASAAAGLSTKEAWYVDKGTRGPDAMRAAAQAGGYTLWGLVPFLRLKQQQSQLPLEPLVTHDQLLKSVMVTIVVDPRKVSGVNAKGARSLEQYLIEAETQAKVRNFRMAGVAEQVWWPAAQDNEKAIFGRAP